MAVLMVAVVIVATIPVGGSTTEKPSGKLIIELPIEINYSVIKKQLETVLIGRKPVSFYELTSANVYSSDGNLVIAVGFKTDFWPSFLNHSGEIYARGLPDVDVDNDKLIVSVKNMDYTVETDNFVVYLVYQFAIIVKSIFGDDIENTISKKLTHEYSDMYRKLNESLVYETNKGQSDEFSIHVEKNVSSVAVEDIDILEDSMSVLIKLEGRQSINIKSEGELRINDDDTTEMTPDPRPPPSRLLPPCDGMNPRCIPF